MAFGDQGRWNVVVEGVPFRMDGDTYEEAQARVLDMLGDAPELFDIRTKKLGLDQRDVDALRLRFDAGDSDAPLKGLVRAEDAVLSPANRLAIGFGRQLVNRWRGAKQAVTELFGDVDGSKAIAEHDEDERKLYQQLDEAGVGLEDLGEIGADISAFVVSGATGLVPTALVGAAVGASSVKEEGEGGRGLDALLGGSGALVGPLIGGTVAKAKGLIGALRPGASVQASPGVWLRFLGLRGRPGSTANILQQALAMTEAGVDKGRQIIGRAALDKVQQIFGRLPSNATDGLKDEAAYGVLRTAVQKATTTVDGVNVFNPAAFEKAATPLLGRVGSMFSKDEAGQMVVAIGAVTKAMQRLPESVGPKAAEAAAMALRMAPDRAEPIIKALNMATNPSVKMQLWETLVAIGGNVTAVFNRAPSQAIAGAGANVAVEGTDDVSELL